MEFISNGFKSVFSSNSNAAATSAVTTAPIKTPKYFIHLLSLFFIIVICIFAGYFAGKSSAVNDIRNRDINKAEFIGYSFFIFLFVMIVLGTWILFCDLAKDNYQIQLYYSAFLISIFASLFATIAYAPFNVTLTDPNVTNVISSKIVSSIPTPPSLPPININIPTIPASICNNQLLGQYYNTYKQFIDNYFSENQDNIHNFYIENKILYDAIYNNNKDCIDTLNPNKEYEYYYILYFLMVYLPNLIIDMCSNRTAVSNYYNNNQIQMFAYFDKNKTDIDTYYEENKNTIDTYASGTNKIIISLMNFDSKYEFYYYYYYFNVYLASIAKI